MNGKFAACQPAGTPLVESSGLERRKNATREFFRSLLGNMEADPIREGFESSFLSDESSFLSKMQGVGNRKLSVNSTAASPNEDSWTTALGDGASVCSFRSAL